MQRFFCPSANISGGKIVIDDRDRVHHLKNVLRLKIHDKVVIFDDRGNEYKAKIEKISWQNAAMIIQEKYQTHAQKKVKITVACALTKGSKMDDIIDKLTQLGAERIIPLLTERVIVKLDRHKALLRKARWEKIAQTASQQSHRNDIPLIEAPKDIREVLAEAKNFDLKLIPTLSGNRKSLRGIFTPHLVKSRSLERGAGFTGVHPKNILVLIGPEGDFTAAEVDLAKKSGCIPVSLGDLVLRVETAAIAVASFMRLYENG